MKTYIIKDWAGNVKFDGQEFDSFEDGDEFLSVWINENYSEAERIEEDEIGSIRGEYYVEEV